MVDATANNPAVNALCVLPNGNLVAGGSFTSAGGVAASNIAQWNGTTWSPLGTGISGGAVHSLRVLSNGDLVVGGDFNTAGGLSVTKLARWTGSAWQSFPAFINGSVNALAVLPNGDLVVGGAFTFITNTLVAFRMARWNGSTWSTLNGDVSGTVRAFAMRPGGELVVGGGFQTAGPRVSAYFGRYLSQCVSSYCTAGTTTNGCVPTMSASGTPRVTTTSGFSLSTTNVEGQKSALIFYGISGSKASVWATGSSSFLCVKSPTQRLPAQNSGGTANLCNGSITVDWLNYLSTRPNALGQPFAPGQEVYVQAWLRDPPAPATTNLSNALQFTTRP
jgi:hypothetical protein